ncbi:MAG TPA: hypothetical protein IAC47_02400 [Candidatus Onthomorpha intestinigallinarum]|uniref:Trigger factor ribosome-binding bacterial domain-containing protein n=1 Tax=Candidatus Onthomorpha intestinigallinarum TaxID=2840880 RepID=A0A9D1RGD3_9BACT|nr:hypothetical protein [Candidatus Onthomorpha intestinigallinarum]
MNVTKETTGDLTAVLKIEVSSEDYKEAVEKELKNYRKKANMPGFRPGQVPMGLIKKMYEKPVRAEQVQNVMTEAMYKYIDDNKIELLGTPMANNDKTPQIDWDNQFDYTFYFDIALQPSFDIDLSSQNTTYYRITPTDDILNRFVEDIQRRFGKFEVPETVGENDLVYGEIKELNQEGNVKEGGIQTPTSLSVDLISMVTIKKKFLGAKKDDVIVFNLAKAFKNVTELAAMLRIDKEKAKEFKSDVEFRISSISRITKHELNEELYSKAYANRNIKTEEEFRQAAKEDLVNTYSKEADRYFLNETSKQLVETSKIELPDEFMKRWLIETNQGKVDEKEITDNYNTYRDSIKWQLIESKLMEKYKLEVSKDEIKTYYKDALISNYFPVVENETEEQKNEREKSIEKIADNMLENKEQGKQVYEYLFDQKLTATLKSQTKCEIKEISMEDFSQLIKKQ